MPIPLARHKTRPESVQIAAALVYPWCQLAAVDENGKVN